MRGDGTSQIERRADVARARLLGPLHDLDRRRRELFDWKLQLGRHSGAILGVFGGLAAGVVVTTGIGAYREGRRRSQLGQERWHALGRLWRHPERVAAPTTSALGAAARMLLVAFATMATTTIGINQLGRFRRRPRLPRHPTEPIGV